MRVYLSVDAYPWENVSVEEKDALKRAFSISQTYQAEVYCYYYNSKGHRQHYHTETYK